MARRDDHGSLFASFCNFLDDKLMKSSDTDANRKGLAKLVINPGHNGPDTVNSLIYTRNFEMLGWTIFIGGTFYGI